MTKYILKRLLLLLLSLFIVITITFFLMDLMPGHPTALETQANKPGVKIDDLLKAHHLNDPVFTRYTRYLSGIFHGDFGEIYSTAYKGVSIPTMFFKPLKYSMMVTVPAFVVSTILGVIFGFIAGYKRGKWQDTLINVFAMIFVAVPSFILAILFILLGNKVGLPTSFEESLGISYETLSLILPILVLTLGGFAVLTYYTRNEVVEVLKSDFVAIARAKGLSERQIMKRHILRNVSIPLVSIILPSFIILLTGSLIIERFFAVPGTSNVVVTAVQNKETYIILFSILFFATLTMLVQLLVDVLYVVIDPRIKIAQSQKMSMYKRMKYAQARKKAYQEANNGGDK